MSQVALQKSIDSTLSQFRDEVKASRNLLLAEVRVALTTQDVKLSFSPPDFDAFQRDFDDYVAKTVKGQAKASLENAALAFVASTAGAIAAEQLAIQMLRLLTVEAVAAGVEAAAAGGSSTAAGGALGGATGWVGGPGGAVIGVGVGLVFGAIIDWWVTDKFKSYLTAELNGYLDNLERTMIGGVAPIDSAERKPGLREVLRKAADKMHSIQGEAVLKALAEAK